VTSGGNNFNDFPHNQLTKCHIYWLIPDFYPLKFYETSRPVLPPPTYPHSMDAPDRHNTQTDTWTCSFFTCFCICVFIFTCSLFRSVSAVL